MFSMIFTNAIIEKKNDLYHYSGNLSYHLITVDFSFDKIIYLIPLLFIRVIKIYHK